MTYDGLFSLFLKMHPDYFQSAIDWRPQGRCEIKIWIRSNEIIYAKWHESTKTFEIRSSKYDIQEEKGCDFCNGEKTITVGYLGNIDVNCFLSPENDSYIDIDCSGEYCGELKPNFCLVCGKKLN